MLFVRVNPVVSLGLRILDLAEVALDSSKGKQLYEASKVCNVSFL